MAAASLEDVRAYIHEVGLGKTRAQILKNQLLARKGRILDSLTDETTHVIVGGKVTHTKLLQALDIGELPSHVHVVSADWLSACFVHDSLMPVVPYLVDKTTPKPSPQKAEIPDQQCPPGVGVEEDSGRMVEDAVKDLAKGNSFGARCKGKRPKISPKKEVRAEKVEAPLGWQDYDSDYVDSDEDHTVRCHSEEEAHDGEEETVKGSGIHLHSGKDTGSTGGPSPKKVSHFLEMRLSFSKGC